MALNINDRSSNAQTLNTATPTGGQHVLSASATDAATGYTAQVAVAHTLDNRVPGASAASLFVAAMPEMVNILGNLDRQREAGGNMMAAAGVPMTAVGVAMRSAQSTTTTVTAGNSSATLAVAATAGFKVGGLVGLEPGTANYELGLITAVSANTSLSVLFPAGGALFTHTQPYPIESFAYNQAEMAPGPYGAQLVSSDGRKPTYRFAVQGITPVATPTDVFQLQGSASVTRRVKRIKIGGIATTAGALTCQLIRRSTAGTPGTAVITAISAGQHDTLDPAPAGTAGYVQTANYTTLGTAAGVLAVGRLFLNVAATGPTSEVVFEFATRQDKALILRGASDYLWVNFAGATLPAGTALDFEAEVEEDAS